MQSDSSVDDDDEVLYTGAAAAAAAGAVLPVGLELASRVAESVCTEPVDIAVHRRAGRRRRRDAVMARRTTYV